MSKKDYELIARIFNKNITDTNEKVAVNKYTPRTVNVAMAKQFADALATTNPRFDRTKFLIACGVKEN